MALVGPEIMGPDGAVGDRVRKEPTFRNLFLKAQGRARLETVVAEAMQTSAIKGLKKMLKN